MQRARVVLQEEVVRLSCTRHLAIAIKIVAELQARAFAKVAAGGAFLDTDEDFFALFVRRQDGHAEEVALDPVDVQLGDLELAFHGHVELFAAWVVAYDVLKVVERFVVASPATLRVCAHHVGVDERGVVGVIVNPLGGLFRSFLGFALFDERSDGHELALGRRGVDGGLLLPLALLELILLLCEG